LKFSLVLGADLWASVVNSSASIFHRWGTEATRSTTDKAAEDFKLLHHQVNASGFFRLSAFLSLAAVTGLVGW